MDTIQDPLYYMYNRNGLYTKSFLPYPVKRDKLNQKYLRFYKQLDIGNDTNVLYDKQKIINIIKQRLENEIQQSIYQEENMIFKIMLNKYQEEQEEAQLKRLENYFKLSLFSDVVEDLKNKYVKFQNEKQEKLNKTLEIFNKEIQTINQVDNEIEKLDEFKEKFEKDLLNIFKKQNEEFRIELMNEIRGEQQQPIEQPEEIILPIKEYEEEPQTAIQFLKRLKELREDEKDLLTYRQQQIYNNFKNKIEKLINDPSKISEFELKQLENKKKEIDEFINRAENRIIKKQSLEIKQQEEIQRKEEKQQEKIQRKEEIQKQKLKQKEEKQKLKQQEKEEEERKEKQRKEQKQSKQQKSKKSKKITKEEYEKQLEEDLTKLQQENEEISKQEELSKQEEISKQEKEEILFKEDKRKFNQVKKHLNDLISKNKLYKGTRKTFINNLKDINLPSELNPDKNLPLGNSKDISKYKDYYEKLINFFSK